MPAEWEPHEATWLGWPHNASDWPGRFPPIPWAYGEIVRKLAPGEQVRIIASRADEARARRILKRVGVPAEQTEFFRFPTDRGWTRDFGPIFVVRSRGNESRARSLSRGALRAPQTPSALASDLAIARFRFNGWAKYPDWRKDDRVPERAAKALKRPLVDVRAKGRPVVLEGGSIDVNGRGSLLTTEECLLDPAVQVRNPGLGRAEMEAVFREYLGAPNVMWLGRGIAGDDTHGHVDDLCRFVGPRTVVLCRERDPRNPNYGPLEENRERLQGMRLEDGSRPEVVDLPMPAPLFFDGRRLPASYANFYIANAALLVPTFNDPADCVALGVLGDLMRDRPVVGIHAVDLVWGLGTLHCLTQQQPRSRTG
jgi:agmatine deiminase